MNSVAKSKPISEPALRGEQWFLTSSDWRGAATSGRQADPFCCTPAWQLSYHNSFAPNRRLLIEEDSKSVVAFAERIISPNFTCLTPLEDSWQFGSPLIGNRATDLLADMMTSIEKRYSPQFPSIMISGVRPRGLVYKNLKRRFERKFRFHRHRFGTQCSASLLGGLDGYLGNRSSNFRRNLRKQSRRALEDGVVLERRSPTTDQEVDEVYSRMISVELASWKGVGCCGMAEPGPRKFYEIMMAYLAATGDARVIFAKHDNKDIGFIFGGVSGGIYRGQQFSYDEEWQSASIGNVLQMEQIAWACEEGISRYDMGPIGGAKMNYKTHWTERRHRMETWILSRG
jgi:hypothetical protein